METQHISYLSAFVLLHKHRCVLCEQSEMLIKMYNSHSSHFFLLAALLLSVALSVEELIRAAAERSRRLGVGATVRLQLSVYIKCVRFRWIDVEFVAYHLRMKAGAVSVACVQLSSPKAVFSSTS